MQLDDRSELKQARIESFLGFELPEPYEHAMGLKQAGPPSGQSFQHSQLTFFGFMERLQNFYPIYLLKLINFIGRLAVGNRNEGIMIAILRAHQGEYERWVWPFINQVSNDRSLIKRAQQQFNINLQQLQDQTISMYRQILQINDGVVTYEARQEHAAQNLEDIIPMPGAVAPSNDQGRFDYFDANAQRSGGESPSSAGLPPGGGTGEENVRNLAGAAQNESFSNTNELGEKKASPPLPAEKIDFYPSGQ